MVHPYHEILLSSKKERAIGICRGLNEPYLSEKANLKRLHSTVFHLYNKLLNDRSLEIARD